jgi:fatty acid desaturase
MYRAAPRRRALAVSAFAVFTALVCGGLITIAILVPAPIAVLPLIALVCVGLPMLAAWQLAHVQVALGGLRPALRAGRRRPLDEAALHDLQRSLARLPETAHPLED